MVRGPSGALIISSYGSPVLFRLMVLKTVHRCEGFQVFAVVTVQIRVVFWDFTLCSVFCLLRRFGGTNCSRFQSDI